MTTETIISRKCRREPDLDSYVLGHELEEGSGRSVGSGSLNAQHRSHLLLANILHSKLPVCNKLKWCGQLQQLCCSGLVSHASLVNGNSSFAEREVQHCCLRFTVTTDRIGFASHSMATKHKKSHNLVKSETGDQL